MDREDLIWIAGILDSKNHMPYFSKCGECYEYITLDIFTSNEQLIKEVAELLQVESKRHKREYRIRMRGSTAVNIIKQVLPFIRNEKLYDSFVDIVNDYD